MAPETDTTLLVAHVRAFNHGVRTGDWSPMLARFDPDAELRFEPGPAFHGLEEIRSAYAERPPDDTIVLLGAQAQDEHTLVAGFAWSKGGTGRMTLRQEAGLIRSLTVAFDER